MILEIPMDVVFKDLDTHDVLCFTCAVRRIVTTDTRIVMTGDNRTRECFCCGNALQDTITED
jgi:hypothetical protein